MRPQIVLFADENGKVYRGKVIYFEDWYEKHLRNEESKIFDIEFDKENMPDELRECDIPQVIKYAREEFKEKTGMTWEAYNELACRF